MKKLYLIILLNLSLYSVETVPDIDITPPTLANMNNYTEIIKEKKNSKTDTDEKPKIIKNQVLNIPENKDINIINNNLSKNNSKSIKDTKKQETKVQTITTYKTTVNSDVISNQDIKECEIIQKSISEIAYEKGYNIGLKNSKYEIENWLKKFKPYLDDIFTIKDYYIEGILEPPIIEFDNKSYIKDNGKRYVKKEGEYKIVREARFRNPLTWEDFLLSGHLEKPQYQFKYHYYVNEECKEQIRNKDIENAFLNGYEYARKESIILYKERLKKLKNYIEKLNRYQRLYLTKKILPPVITPMITPIKTKEKDLLISEEQYVIVKNARFNPLYKNWLNFIISNDNVKTRNKR